MTFESFANELKDVGRTRIVKRMTAKPGIPLPKHAPLVLIEMTANNDESSPVTAAVPDSGSLSR